MIHTISRHNIFLAKNFSFPQKDEELCQSCSSELLSQKSRESHGRTPDIQRNSNRTKALEDNTNNSALYKTRERVQYIIILLPELEKLIITLKSI